MRTPRFVVFSALQGALFDAASFSWTSVADALGELERSHVPVVLVTERTRAWLESMRRKIEHGHPFITESGGGLFLPDGYFPVRIPEGVRVGRYFCVRFARTYDQVTEALKDIAEEAGASVVGYSQMNTREIAHNTNESLQAAELDRHREFSERFFFAGENEGPAQRFLECATRRGWEAIPGNPFWELRSNGENHIGRAVRYLMRLYRTAQRSRLISVGIGSTALDWSLLSSVDHPITLPLKNREYDASLLARLPHATLQMESGTEGWNNAIRGLLKLGK